MAPWSGGKAKLATPVPTANNLSMQTLAFMAVVTTWLVALTYHTYSVNTQTFATTPAHLARETSGGFAGSSFRASSPHVFFGPNATYLEGLATCESFKCVREAHDLPRALPGSPGESAGTRFNWPHFFIAGYSKSATTSLYMYLNKHPQTSAPVTKGTIECLVRAPPTSHPPPSHCPSQSRRRGRIGVSTLETRSCVRTCSSVTIWCTS